MTWNYRIVKRVNKPTKRNGLKEPVVWYAMHEVFYHKHGKKYIADSRTLEPDAVIGDTREECIEQLEMMLKDAKKAPVINEEDIGGRKDCKKRNCNGWWSKKTFYSKKKNETTVSLENINKLLEQTIENTKGESNED